jgi:aldehyde dehydrogenase (NAD+)
LDEVMSALERAYGTLRIGDPFDSKTHVGPVVSHAAFDTMRATLSEAQREGGQLMFGGDRVAVGQEGVYVKPALMKMPEQTSVMQSECFAPLLFVVPYRAFDEAIRVQNGVPQGLSSAVFTESMREAEVFLGPAGSDCGIANVNIGTSGAEIGGAFGGEKDTGGGRESGSDAWKNYMRRCTNTINYGTELPLAQGIEFSI